ncbi:MAG TPA: hypothetical protein PKC21_09545 [Oligoflexia bacterium]|nr:hypothetical protein [Oligoflexia bacterium]HMR25581.1 hypothetical protein [Oligoflexia bacterium]
MNFLNTYPKRWLILPCLLVSSVVLYVLPQSFWLRFYVSVSQINKDAVDEEQVLKLQQIFLPKNTQCQKSSNNNTYFCTQSSLKKSEQRQSYALIQKNQRQGFLSKVAFSDLLESKINQIQQLRQDNVDLELKLIDLDEKLSEEDKKAVLDWQSKQQAIESELSFNQQRLRFFQDAITLAQEKENNVELYEEKLKDINTSIADLQLEASSLNAQKENFNSNQIAFIAAQSKLNTNNQERESLLKKTAFLEDINNSYKNENFVPDPEKIQWEISQLRLKTQRFSLAKLFYVIPLTFLLFGLCIHSRNSLLHYRNQYNLSTDEMAQILNASFLGDLNSFFSKNTDKSVSNDS